MKGFGTDSISVGYNKTGEVSREANFDLGNDLNTGEPLLDLDNEPAGLLGDYLNYIIENAENVFGINPGNERAASSNRGDSLVLAEEQGAEKVYVEQGTEKAGQLNQYSNSQYFDSSGTQLDSLIDKTSASGDSHNLLTDIEGKPLSNSGETLSNQEGEDNNVVKAVNNVLIRNNRFANVGTKDAYANKAGNISDFEASEDESKLISQNIFGDFNLNDHNVTLDQLKEVGLSLLYKASGYDSGDQPGDSVSVEDLEAQIGDAEFFDNLITDAGYRKIDFRSSRPKYAKGAPEDMLGNSTRDNRGDFFSDDPEADSTKAFGVINTPNVNFSGRGKKILKLKAAIACLALKKITSDFMDQISEFIKLKDLRDIEETSDTYATLDKTYNGPGPHIMGAYKQLNSLELDILKKLVLIRTDYPYAACYEKGIEVMFGSKDEVNDVKDYDHINQAPGYWLSIASSTLKSFDQLSSAFSGLESFESDLGDKVSTLVDLVKSNKLVRFANAAATIGDIFFKSNHGLFQRSVSTRRPYNVDSIPAGPGSRVGKSRDDGAESPLSLSWRQGSVPSMYLLPRNVVKASLDLNTVLDGASPARGMLSSVLVKNTYLDRQHAGSFNRIPDDVVKRLENKLEAEYVPFYIQDLRTNEIISFHAFLTSLNDNIKADYNPVTGYGRMDPVQIYRTTSRTVSVGFVIYATSKEDFDSMWYKINKLTTLLYPQWTQGTQLSSDGTDRFVQPFSQVLGASPIVRLRVGDVIKSNYSRFNLARMFGIGDQNINAVTGTADTTGKKIVKKAKGKANNVGLTLSEILLEAFYVFMGTPLQYIPTSAESRRGTQGLTIGRNALSNLLINGFVNPLGPGVVLRNLIDPNSRALSSDSSSQDSIASYGASIARDIAEGVLGRPTSTDDFGYTSQTRVLVKSNIVRGYRASDGTVIRNDRPLKAVVLKRSSEKIDMTNSSNLYVSDENFVKLETKDNAYTRTSYVVKIVDISAPSDVFQKEIDVDHQYLLPDPRDIFFAGAGAFLAIAQPRSMLDYVVDRFVSDSVRSFGLGSEAVDMIKELYANETEKFMQPENNPFTRALESTAGRGLAGVLDGVQFSWYNNDFTWETDYNSRAPRGVEISFNLNVIHDLPPGLDHSGYNKAPLYNVGTIMKESVGDARGDDAGAELEYTKHGNVSKTGK